MSKNCNCNCIKFNPWTKFNEVKHANLSIIFNGSDKEEKAGKGGKYSIPAKMVIFCEPKFFMFPAENIKKNKEKT